MDDFVLNDSFSREEHGPLVLWRFDAAPPGARVFFTTRAGGVSALPYESLNLGFYVGDYPDKVLENRARLCRALGLDAAAVTSPRQRHSAEAILINDERQAGAGASGGESVLDPCDALVTGLAGVPLMLHYADCVPVVLASRIADKSALAVIHAGRTGLMDGVIRSGLDLMVRNMGAVPESVVAAIGPAIGSCCYEVDDASAEEFEAIFGGETVSMGRFLDLQGAATQTLMASGISGSDIHVLDICTSCNSDFFSYRREGTTGRHGAIAWLDER